MPEVGRILLVEDEALLAKGIVRGITRRGLGECVVAGTVAEAIACLKNGTRYTALIIDIGLTDGSGLDVLAAARQSDHYVLTPVIVLTGSHEPRFINRATKLRARYLVKPVEMDDLADELRDAVSLAPRIELAIARLRVSHAFADILKRGALGESRDAIAQARGTSPKTIENQIVDALGHTGHPSFHSLVEEVLREVARAR